MSLLLILLWVVPSLAVPCPGGEDCMWKCCPAKMVIAGNKCVPGDGVIAAPKGVRLHYGRPFCDMYYLFKDESHTINLNGTLTLDGEVMDYCVDWNELNSTYTYVCLPEYDEVTTENVDQSSFRLYSIGLFCSTPFLLATFLVYLFLKRTRLHDLCIIFHTLSMLLSYLFLALAQMGVFQGDFTCAFTGTIHYIIYLSILFKYSYGILNPGK